MTDSTVHQAARGQIDTLISNLEAMLQTLQEERQALSTADATALEEIAARKALAVETVSRQYEDFRQGFGLNSDTEGDSSAQTFNAALHNFRAAAPELAERLDQLVALTRACRQSNQDNGTLVNLGMHNCQTNLNLLHRLSQPYQPSTYGPGAQPEGSIDSLHRLQLRA